MKRAELSELAEGDLADIWVLIATDDIDTADRFVDALRAQAQRLAEQPLMGRERPEFGKQVRSFPHGQYLVIYRPIAEGIAVARIVHGARDLWRLDIPAP